MVDLQAKTIEMLQEDVWNLHAKIRKLEVALREIAYTEPEDKYWPGRIARKALENEK